MHLFIRCFIMCAFSCFVYLDLCLMLHVRVSCVCVFPALLVLVVFPGWRCHQRPSKHQFLANHT